MVAFFPQAAPLCGLRTKFLGFVMNKAVVADVFISEALFVAKSINQ